MIELADEGSVQLAPSTELQGILKSRKIGCGALFE